MMTPADGSLEGLLCVGVKGHQVEVEGVETFAEGSSLTSKEEWTMVSDSQTNLSVEEPMTCAGCGGRVCDRYVLLAAGRAWHGACLRCSQCHCELQAHLSLYCRDGSIFCQQDYCRLFSIGRCARCSQPIPSSTMVMRSGDLTFHPECFSCQQECDVTLMPGNLYCMQGQSLYCQSHYHDDNSLTAPPTNTVDFRHTQREGEGEESISSPEPRLDRSSPGGRARRRTKRIRTCFRSEQLRTLESYFALKHNPDGKDWSCLSHRTGLPKRVLQVWFQNARAKLRRSISADDSLSNSPAAPPRPDAMATTSPSPERSQSFQTSTIDQLEFSLLTAPLSDLPRSPGAGQSQRWKDSFFLDYSSQGAPECISPLTVYDFVESCAARDGESENSPKAQPC